MAVAAVAVALAMWPWGCASVARERTEVESFALLRGCDTPERADAAVGPLGVRLTARNGEWVAVRYRDSHAAPGWSSAVARDSQGGWFVSHRHFCGLFAEYRRRRADLRGPEFAADPELRALAADMYGDLLAAEDAPDLAALRQLVIGLGFQVVPRP